MTYNICIGKMWDIDQRMYIPEKKMRITEEQKEVVLLFAEKRIDEKCNPIYKIGLCEFTIEPNFKEALREAMK